MDANETLAFVEGGDELWAKTKLYVALRALHRIVEAPDPQMWIDDAREWLEKLAKPELAD